jgi:DNA processing protein
MRLARSERVGPATYKRLLQRFGSAVAAVEGLPDLARAGGGKVPSLISHAAAEREFERAERAGARVLFFGEPDYPTLLALLHDAPPVLSVLGDVTQLARGGVAIVGSRNASGAGCLVAEQLAEGLAQAGQVVVSGLARGVDAAAHDGALRQGVTVAAVAGGLDQPYPPEHAPLQARIAERGAVVAEAPFGTAPQARHFPRRNRVIAGLALGIVVVEATARSGSLITARIGLEAGRELFAVPGSPLDPRCKGCNELIRQGAHLTETVEDVLAWLPAHPAEEGVQRLRLFAGPQRQLPGLGEPPSPFGGIDHTEIKAVRAQLEVLLGVTPVSVDDLVDRCQVSAAAVNAVLLELELAGRAEILPGNRVARPVTDADRDGSDRCGS